MVPRQGASAIMAGYMSNQKEGEAMAIKRESIGDKIARIERLTKHRDLVTGMFYNKREELQRGYKKITLWGLFVSDENTFLLRPHLFESKEKRNAIAWDFWLNAYYGTILRESILPGMFNRTEKHWRLYRIIGWSKNDNRRSLYTAVSKQRNKAKRAGR